MNPHRECFLLYAKSIPFNSHTFMKQPQTHTPVSTQEKKNDGLFIQQQQKSFLL